MTETVSLEGVTLNARVDGPGDAPWLVLSNSLGSTHAMWDPQMPFLTSKYRVLRYDTRGHGASSVATGATDFDALVGDAIGVMDHFGVERAAFMGLSLGGMTGLGIGLAHPDRIERVVCADARADAPPPYQAMWDQRIAAIEGGGLEAIADGTLAMWLTEDWRTEHPDETAAIREMIVGNDAGGYVTLCHALKQLDYLKDLGSMTVPVLYVGGAEDKGAAPEVMRAMADATPGGRFVEIPAAGHVANINRPDAFNAAIAEFLGIG